MASYYQQVCSSCSATESSNGWKKVEELGTWVCCECFDDIIAENVSSDEEVTREISSRRYTRVTRSTKYCSQQSVSNQNGKGRRWIFKKKIPMKAPKKIYNPFTSNYLDYNGLSYEAGDIVKVVGTEFEYSYAQIRKFIINCGREKCASVIWLVPASSRASVNEESGFNPLAFRAGPEEDEPLKLSHLSFVMHLPLDFFKSYTTPFPHVDISVEEGEYLFENFQRIIQKYRN